MENLIQSENKQITLGELLNDTPKNKTKKDQSAKKSDTKVKPKEIDITVMDASPTAIKVIGIGGAGCNALNKMVSTSLKGISFLAIHSNPMILSQSLSKSKIAIPTTGNSFGTGGDPEVGKKGAIKMKVDIKKELEGVNMLFITAGLGGGTGTGVAPLIAKMASELDILTIGIVTRPFNFEGTRRAKNAEQGLEELEKYCDSLIVISNEQLLSTLGKIPIRESFEASDNILYHSVKTITDLITTTSLINLDFADVYSVMKGRGAALIGVGKASGKNRASEAAKQAVDSPLLDGKLNGSVKILLNIAGGDSLSIEESSEVVSEIEKYIGDTSDVIFGVTLDESLEDELQVTLIATSQEYRTNDRSQNLFVRPTHELERELVFQRELNKIKEEKLSGHSDELSVMRLADSKRNEMVSIKDDLEIEEAPSVEFIEDEEPKTSSIFNRTGAGGMLSQFTSKLKSFIFYDEE